ncbi:hypothetical protein VRK_05850 [Vibrio sp. MEBiC08052]|nr:hypothetical protein VRK_05850 [Vibrio sp. MEBiC08052]
MKSIFCIISVCVSSSHSISHLQASAVTGMSRQMKRDIFS